MDPIIPPTPTPIPPVQQEVAPVPTFWDDVKGYFAKYISQLVMLVTILGLCFFVYTLVKKSKSDDAKFQNLIGTEQKYQQLTKNLAELQSKYEAQTKLLQEVQAQFAEVKLAKNDQVKSISDSTFQVDAKTTSQTSPDATDPKTGYKYYELNLNGAGTPPIGYVAIKDNTVLKGNYSFDIKVDLLQTVNSDTGKVNVYSKAYLVEKADTSPNLPGLQKSTWVDKEYPLNIVGGTADIDPTQPSIDPKSFHLWVPHVNGGFNVGADVGGAFAKPMLSFSTMGWGRSRNDLDWKFLAIGAAIDTKLSNPDLNFEPFSYRLFQPYLTNTYVGPGAGISKNGMNYFINFAVGF